MCRNMLRRFLRLAVLGTGSSNSVITGARRPLGYQQITVNTAKSLTLPASPTGAALTCNFAIIENQDTAIYVRWRDDGTAPDSTHGCRIPPGGQLQYAGDLAAIQFIGESGSPVINVSVYA